MCHAPQAKQYCLPYFLKLPLCGFIDVTEQEHSHASILRILEESNFDLKIVAGILTQRTV